MRVFMFSCALAALNAQGLYAQTFNDVIPPERRSIDFGAVPKTAKTEHRFELVNPFQTDMVLQGVRTSCGCTTPTIETKIIKPGETGYVVAKFNTDRFNGEKKAALTLSISQPHFTELQLNVKGYIRTDIVLNPPEAAFGSVSEGEVKKLRLELNYAGRHDWQVLNITSPFPFVKASSNEVSRSNGRVQYAIDVELDASAPEGYLENQIVIHTNDHRLKTFPIRFSATVAKPVQVAPPRLALGKVKPGEPIAKRMTVSSKSNFQVMGLKSEVAEILYEPIDKSSRVHMLQVVIRPKAPTEFAEGEVNGYILMETDVGDTPVRIPLSFTIETDKLADSN